MDFIYSWVWDTDKPTKNYNMATIQDSVKASQRSCHKKLRPEGLAWLGAGVQSKEKSLGVGLGLGKTGRVHFRNWKFNMARIGREAKKARMQTDARRGSFTKGHLFYYAHCNHNIASISQSSKLVNSSPVHWWFQNIYIYAGQEATVTTGHGKTD